MTELVDDPIADPLTMITGSWVSARDKKYSLMPVTFCVDNLILTVWVDSRVRRFLNVADLGRGLFGFTQIPLSDVTVERRPDGSRILYAGLVLLNIRMVGDIKQFDYNLGPGAPAVYSITTDFLRIADYNGMSALLQLF